MDSPGDSPTKAHQRSLAISVVMPAFAAPTSPPIVTAPTVTASASRIDQVGGRLPAWQGPSSIEAIGLATSRRQVQQQREADSASGVQSPAGQRIDTPATAGIISAAAQASAPSFGDIVRYTLFNKAPEAHPVQSPGQSPAGVVSGQLAGGPDSSVLSYVLSGPPSKGSVVLGSDGTYTYSPATDLGPSGGTDTFSVTIDNGSAYRLTGLAGALQGVLHSLAQAIGLSGSDTTTVTVPVTIAPFNRPPKIAGYTIGNRDTNGVVTGLVNASDPDDDTLSYSAPTSTAMGTVSIDASSGAFTYTPGISGSDASVGGGASVTDAFSVTVSDSHGATAVVSVTVPSGPDAPHVTFELVYGAGSEYWTADARSYLQSAANYVASYFVVPSSVTVTFVVEARNEPEINYLAMGGPLAYGRFTSGWETLPQTKILTGIDSNGADPDAQLIWNFAYQWSGTESQTYGYTYQTVAIHELLHCLAFFSGLDSSGQVWTVWDTFLTAPDGTRIIGTDIPWSGAYEPNLRGENGGLYFGGPNAEAAWGGPIPLGEPSHLKDPDNPRHVWGGVPIIYSVEIGILRDLGYTVVPQPVMPGFSSPTLTPTMTL